MFISHALFKFYVSRNLIRSLCSRYNINFFPNYLHPTEALLLRSFRRWKKITHKEKQKVKKAQYFLNTRSCPRMGMTSNATHLNNVTRFVKERLISRAGYKNMIYSLRVCAQHVDVPPTRALFPAWEIQSKWEKKGSTLTSLWRRWRRNCARRFFQVQVRQGIRERENENEKRILGTRGPIARLFFFGLGSLKYTLERRRRERRHRGRRRRRRRLEERAL